MKPAPFTYHDPTTLEETLELLATLDNAKILAGGQSLMPMMNFRYVMPDHIVDVNRLIALRFIKIVGRNLEIGAGTRQRDLEFSDDVASCCPLMAEALAHVGHRQTRNRGTIGGSLCHLDPSAELPTVAMATDATLHIAGKRGVRAVAMASFPQGYMATCLEPSELLTGITLPTWPKGHGYSFVEFARRRGDFAIVAVGALLALDDNGSVSRASITLAGIGSAPIRLPRAESILLGQTPSDSLFKEAAKIAQGIKAGADIHASSDYRQHLAGILTSRALRQASSRAVPSATLP
ncbi:MAG: FAD binding domain-containing protein [Xanthobacteraceae bacterium]